MHGETTMHEKKSEEIPVLEKDVHEAQPEGMPAPKTITMCEPNVGPAEAANGEDDDQVTHVHWFQEVSYSVMHAYVVLG